MKPKVLFIMLVGFCMLCACSSDDENNLPIPIPDAEESSDSVSDVMPGSALKELTFIEDGTGAFDASAYASPFTVDEMAVGDGFVHFAFNYFRETMTENANAPALCVSPYSASILLSMLANGAGDVTKAEICEALGIDLSAIGVLDSYCLKTADVICNEDTSVCFQQANAMWAQYQFPVYRSFEWNLANFFDAEIHGIDFGDPTAGQTINAWSSEKTHGMIKKIVDDGSLMGTILMMANAIYFKAPWTVDFGDNVVKGQFYQAGGTASTVDMMFRNDTIQYVSREGFDMVGLPYGNSGSESYMMYIALPHDRESSIASFVESLSTEEWNASKLSLADEYVGLSMPKFRMDMCLDLRQILYRMGLQAMFGQDKADFSLISPSKIGISSIIQDVSLKVDQYGSEAAAVTHIIWATDTGEGDYKPKLIPFVVNRPFFFTIEERTTGTILFMGIVNSL
ncbi:MAG: hypothetical protein IJ528_07795 [Bacteroidaceae bacterium]|nr:hypothetical protein [Bacteroidaceae bacterium]